MVKIPEYELENEVERSGVEAIIDSPESRIRTIREGKYDLYIINIESREDRLKETLEVLERYPIFGIKIFNAIKCSKGVIGCGASHLALMNYAKQKGMKYIIVMEDDNTFNVNCDELDRILEDLITNIDKWNIYNGSPTLHADTFEVYHLFGDFVESTWGSATNFMIYNETCFDRTLTKYNFSQPIDIFLPWNFRQAVYLEKLVAYQRTSFSDISGEETGELYYQLFFSEHERLVRRYNQLTNSTH